MERQKALFFIPTLESGGAERVCVHYVNELKTVETRIVVQIRSGSLLSALRTHIPPVEALTGPHSRISTPCLVMKIFYRTKAISSSIGRLFKIGFVRNMKAICPPIVRLLKVDFARNMKVICLPIVSLLKIGFAHNMKAIGPPMVRLFKIGFVRKYLYLFRSARQLKRFAAQNGCTVIVSFLPYTNAIAILAKVIFNRHLKVVINVHSLKSDILSHVSVDPEDASFMKSMIRQWYPKADMIVAVASGVKSDLVENFSVPAEKIIVIHNPIDIQTVRERSREDVEHPWFADTDIPLVIAMGRLVKLKGFDILIRAFAQLIHQTNARLMIIGGGEEERALRELIEELFLHDHVVLLGYQENPWKYMVKARVFVLSSLTEAFPNVIGEALALGLPVLATSCSPGVREYLQEGQYGLLVPPGNATVLAKELERLLIDRNLRESLTEGSHKYMEHFDLSNIVQTYGASLQRIL